MQIKNKVIAAAFLLAFSWFTPMLTILSQLLLGLIGILFSTANISWTISNIFDMTILLIAHIIFMWVLLKKFSKQNIIHGIMIFALLNILAGFFIFRNPVSTYGLFYQTVNFLSNVIMSFVVFVPETGKPYMMLLPFVTLVIHLLLVQLVTSIKNDEERAPKQMAESDAA